MLNGRCQQFASTRSKRCECNIAQISLLWRYSLSASKAHYKKPRSGDGTKFEDEYVKFARGSSRLCLCGSKRGYWILRRALFKHSKHLTPIIKAWIRVHEYEKAIPTSARATSYTVPIHSG